MTGLPDVHCVLPTRRSPSPAATLPDGDSTRALATLRAVVTAHDRDPDNPWAVVHGMLALGPEIELTNGQPAVAWLFGEYAEWKTVGATEGVVFPQKRGNIRIEPHTDLVLKALTEGGIDPQREVTVHGRPAKVDDLFRYSLYRAWFSGETVSAQSWNDTPWTLQALTACVDHDVAWTAEGGHPMTLDGLTHAVVAKLTAETQFLVDARAAGAPVEKKKQGIFNYTCGGTHLVMGAAYAVARGRGQPGDREAVVAQAPLLLWRMDLELRTVDTLLQQHPEYGVILLDQRMKFLGHLLETLHKMAALGLFAPTPEEQARLVLARAELVKTVDALDAAKAFSPEGLAAIKAGNEQTYLDLIGDAAHAIRGLELATGKGDLAW